MQSTEQKIINYICAQTAGVINLTEEHARAIMLLCASQAMGAVVFSRFDLNNNNWIVMRSIEVEDVKILEVVQKEYANAYEPIISRRFYKYDCIDSKGVSKGTIYTSNNNLF